MVFTVVTVIFLPLSFIAAFFAIDVIEFPRNSLNGHSGLHLSYVAKYLFGIGFSISIPLITIAFVMSDSQGWPWGLKKWFGRHQAKKLASAAIHHHAEGGNFELEKGRPSVESWRYRYISRVDTGGTDRPRRSIDINATSPV